MKTPDPETIAAAQAAQVKWLVPASVTLAQCMLESGWLMFMPPGSNNPFGIKARPGDPYVTSPTYEYVKGVKVRVLANFRKFDTLAQAFDYHGELLSTSAVYDAAMAVANDPEAFCNALTGVYATAPNYGATLWAFIKADNFLQYDLPAPAAIT